MTSIINVIKACFIVAILVVCLYSMWLIMIGIVVLSLVWIVYNVLKEKNKVADD